MREFIRLPVFRREYRLDAHADLTLLLYLKTDRDISVEPSVILTGAGAKATIFGVVYGTGNARIRIRTLQRHMAPSTTSNLLIKTVVADAAESAYTGSVVVEPAAQKTDAYQRNENLLIGSRAHAESSPILEIRANDVRCTHGAVVKMLDPDELWYLKTRGVGDEESSQLLTAGFVRSTFTGIPDTMVREAAETDAEKLLAG